MTKTIVLTGGGTAGHVTPNLAIIPKLRELGFHVEYIGTKDGMEKGIMACNGVPYHTVCAGKFRRYFSLKNLTDPFKIIAGCVGAGRILKKLSPAAVFSKGGFVGVPVVLAAHRQGIPVILHESDYTPGLANRICIPKAKKVCVAFDTTLKYIPKDKGVYTGLPIRSELLNGDKQCGLELCGFSGKKPVLLVMGGSLGARAVNEAIDAALPKLTAFFDVAHIRGKNNMIEGGLPGGYAQFGFIDQELPDIYAAADIMVSRAGATSVFEILALTLPALLIPLPKATSRGDQELNAEYFKTKGFSHVLPQEEMTPETLISAIHTLYNEQEALRSKMKLENTADAADKVAHIIANA